MQIKHIHLLLSLAFACGEVASAAPVSAQQARLTALSFMSQRVGEKMMQKSHSRAEVLLAYTAQNGEYYAFNKTNSNGYVLVSGDDRMPAVIGYSDEGKFDADDMPDNMREWLNTYASQVRYVQAHSDAHIEASTSFITTNVYPLLGNTKWNQSAPYNGMCPTYTTGGAQRRAVTGCVATAMAQVMYYHRWPEEGMGTNSYTCQLNGDSKQSVRLSTDFSQSHYDWANMLPYYTGSETDEQNNAVAKLMSDCGVAMNMGYGASSGAITRLAMNRMPAFFCYDKSIRFVMRDAYSLDQWLHIINGELASKRPVIHTGSSSQGGHAFVIDGSSSSGYYHVNWGWNGMSNGYFIITDLTPSEQGIGSSDGGYNLYQGLVYNIMPDHGSPAGYACCISGFEVGDKTVALGESAQVKWDNFYVLWSGSGNASTRLGIGITDENGKLLQLAADRQIGELQPVYNYSITLSMNVPDSLSEGTYYIVPLVARSGTDNFQIADVSRPAPSRIKMVVKSGHAYFQQPDSDAKLRVTSIEHSDVLNASRMINVKATISNSGKEFVDNLCVALLNDDGTVAATGAPKRVDVQNGAKAQLEASVTPSQAGNFRLAVVLASDSTAVDGESTNVVVGDRPAASKMAIASPLQMANSTFPSTHIEATATVYNGGGAFAGRLEAMILPEKGASVVAQISSDFLTVKKGERKTVKFVGTLTNGEVGQTYRMVMRSPTASTAYTAWGSYVKFCLASPTHGDVNADGVTNATDITALINFILGTECAPFDASEANLNSDGITDVSDVTGLTSLILEQQ